MTPSNALILRACMLAIGASALSTAVLAGDWRQGLVRSVANRTEVDSAVDLDCAPPLPGPSQAKVVVVSYRVGKSHRWRAFNPARDDTYAAGQEVIVDLVDCRLARLPREAGTAPSAP